MRPSPSPPTSPHRADIAGWGARQDAIGAKDAAGGKYYRVDDGGAVHPAPAPRARHTIARPGRPLRGCGAPSVGASFLHALSSVRLPLIRTKQPPWDLGAGRFAPETGPNPSSFTLSLLVPTILPVRWGQVAYRKSPSMEDRADEAATAGQLIESVAERAEWVRAGARARCRVAPPLTRFIPDS
jgi:hypothetical protein